MTFVLPLKSEPSAAAQSGSRKGLSPLTPDEDYPILAASPAGLKTVSSDLQRLSNYVELLASSSSASDLDNSPIPPPEKFRCEETVFGGPVTEVHDITVRNSTARMPPRSTVPVLTTFQVDTSTMNV